jgi:hypothetical protein
VPLYHQEPRPRDGTDLMKSTALGTCDVIYRVEWDTRTGLASRLNLHGSIINNSLVAAYTDLKADKERGRPAGIRGR